ncbi:hypothetical protein ACIRD2_34295 [Streptomyces sp. NPDC093595]|uniref:golvesin C-terminal-like domain-containing protein n=1 Tax=Streptomyces sp. NPDC093595 TaxID=3366045 RepID=UPI00381BB15B
MTVFGQVTAPINTGEEQRALAGARYELWYFGKDGSAGSAPEWRPVLSRVNSNNAPNSDPVKGYLNADGAYAISFVYPQNYTLANGATWHGCPQNLTAPPFLRSKACDASDLELRIYPENSGRSIVVKDSLVPAGSPLAHSVPLGRFYERAAGQQISNSTSARSLTYRAILNTLSAWSGVSSYPTVEATVDDVDHAEAWAGKFRINRSLTGKSVPEHEMGHVMAIHVYGGTPLAGAGCSPHYFTKPCHDTPSAPPNLVSGWWEGLANFTAMAGERPEYNSATYQHGLTGTFDVEDCVETVPSGTLSCQAGEGVEGNVMALLWDLVDSGVDFNTDHGLADDYSAPLSSVLQVIKQSKPTTATEFWRAWATAHSEDNGMHELRFLNRMAIDKFSDASDGVGVGSWASDESCTSCAAGDYIYSTSAGSSYSWNLNDGLSGDGVYDIWVRLPQGQSDADPSATYKIATVNGVEEVVIDQARATDGWINLSPLGFELDSLHDNELVLENGTQTSGSSLVADAVIITRHL